MRCDYDEAHYKFYYENDTGLLIRKVSAGNQLQGSVCTRLSSKGYYRVHLNGKDRFVHRVVWLMHYGEWPRRQLDHINGNKTDNRIENLRECTTSENCINQKGPRKNNSIGVQGVHLIKSSGKYRACFRDKRLGCFGTLPEASDAYQKAKKRYLP